jgi:serine/threonine protein kinase
MRWELRSHEALRRFHYESHLLAQLHHPGIAQVYEAGVHDQSGLRLPYFAMKLVDGAQTIVEHAIAAQLDTDGCLELFARVCDAVEHAHQQGVVHRDLKPSNILVDSDGRPRVIDFGVARASETEIAMASLHTGTGQLIGTLQYMSPEQCAGDGALVDTCTTSTRWGRCCSRC